MTRKRKTDKSDYTGTLAICPRCTRRELLPTDFAAWRWLALHLKRHHGDIHAAQNAAREARRLRALRLR